MKRLAFPLVFIAATILLAVLLQVRQLHRTIPDYGGTIHVAGTSETVEIIRDASAVPHIFAKNQADAFFGLGYVHAQDRMWQMEMARRVVAGRVAELVGKPGLGIDRFVRTADLYGLATRSLPALSEETRALLEAYTAGINTAMKDSRGELSPEFKLLGVPLEPWKPEDSLAVFKMMAVGLSGNMYSELSRLQLLSKLTPEELAEFTPPYPGDEAVIVPPLTELYDGVVTDQQEVTFAFPIQGPLEASNNWVVAGTRTLSGKPLLSNDPHLGFNAPSIWYLAHISLPDRNIIGGTMAGIPAVLAGRTDEIAWGLTTTGADVQDLYLERINPENSGQYQTPDGWANFEVREETIKVRFGGDETVRFRKTRHGPVLPESLLPGTFPPEGYVLALQWTSLEPIDTSLEALMGTFSAGDWHGFNEAFRDFTGPMQNIVYADTAGNIGFVAPAKVPVRGPEHDTMGLLPAPGWRAENDWQGYIPFDDLPRSYNPVSGRLATANSKVTPKGYKHFISSEWSEPWRTWRIEELLDAEKAHDVDDFQAMHLDNTSQSAQALLPFLLSTPALTEDELKVLKLIENWDGNMRADGPEGLIYSVWAHKLGSAIYRDELGDLYSNYARLRPSFLISILSSNDGLVHWCDRTSTEEIETCEDALARALRNTAKVLIENYGPAFENENWGDHHKVVHSHTPFSNIPLLKTFFSIETPTGGGPFTPNQGSYRYTSKDRFQNRHGAGYRAVYDFADMNGSRYIQTTGQSGNVLSKYYRDMAPEWQKGELTTMTTDRGAIEGGMIGKLVLIPKDNQTSSNPAPTPNETAD